MIALLNAINLALFCYYLFTNLTYLFLLVSAISANIMHQRRLASLKLEHVDRSPFTPPIALLVPARNEEGCVVESIRSLLGIDYPELEIVLINDGSTDGTLKQVQEHFKLRKANLLYVPEVRCAEVHALYISTVDRRLLVVDKKSGGNKADAVNAGLNATSSPYVCVVDADSLLEKDALLRMMGGVFSRPSQIAAVGGVVRVLNGSLVERGRLTTVQLPRRPLEILQVIEYLRAFLIGREGWALYNMMTVISGAFGVFRRDFIVEMGGYRHSAIGEDIDLVVRLHRLMRDQGVDYKIPFVPDPVCWTEVPADIRSLARQRARWHKGLYDVLLQNRDMLFRKRFGRLGWIAMPYQWLFELAAPIIELVGYASMLTAALLGVMSIHFFLQFLIFGYTFGSLISVGAVLQEEITYRRYNRKRDVALLIMFCFLEYFPYRQLQMFWRMQGLWQYWRGDVVWKQVRRVGFGETGSARAQSHEAEASTVVPQ
ncbi:MAG TPA: glycosyltransferase [Terriglobales bacterium]|nr:glycosyltransferase [Terriglobales bacterium]